MRDSILENKGQKSFQKLSLKPYLLYDKIREQINKLY